MIWTKKPTPEEGDTRTVTRFALFPTLMSDDITIVWLETYKVEQRFSFAPSTDSFDYYSCDLIWIFQKRYYENKNKET